MVSVLLFPLTALALRRVYAPVPAAEVNGKAPHVEPPARGGVVAPV